MRFIFYQLLIYEQQIICRKHTMNTDAQHTMA
jgi:hypothetical protein